MTLGELWREFGDKFADTELVFSMNGMDAAPVRGAIDFEMADGETVIYMTNQEGVEKWKDK